MDNEKAIKILRKGYPDINRYAASELDAYEYYVETYNEAVSYAISHLEADRWISIKERRPAKTGSYLVNYSNGEVDACFYCYEFSYEFISKYEVTHWKPLPKPYESEAENDT